MTISAQCSYGPDREDAILEYLYGDRDADERSRFATHLTQCPECRAEVASLRGVRQALADWAPPEPMRALEHPSPIGGPRRVAATPTAAVRQAPTVFPAWAKVAAAVLCVGVGLGAANLQLDYSPEGLSVRTGWWTLPPPAKAASGAPDGAEAWRTQLTALEQSLRSDMESLRTAVVSHAPANDDDAVLRQVRALIARSEQRQQSELALRIGDVLNDVQTQRRADLSRIERTIGVVQNNTGMEVMRQREMINTLAVRVSSQR